MSELLIAHLNLFGYYMRVRA